jgi:hypothetical protein
MVSSFAKNAKKAWDIKLEESHVYLLRPQRLKCNVLCTTLILLDITEDSIQYLRTSVVLFGRLSPPPLAPRHREEHRHPYRRRDA